MLNELGFHKKILDLFQDEKMGLKKITNAGFNEDSEFFKLIKDYLVLNSKTGNGYGMAGAVGFEQLSDLYNLYLSDAKVKDFFDKGV